MQRVLVLVSVMLVCSSNSYGQFDPPWGTVCGGSNGGPPLYETCDPLDPLEPPFVCADETNEDCDGPTSCLFVGVGLPSIYVDELATGFWCRDIVKVPTKLIWSFDIYDPNPTNCCKNLTGDPVSCYYMRRCQRDPGDNEGCGYFPITDTCTALGANNCRYDFPNPCPGCCTGVQGATYLIVTNPSWRGLNIDCAYEGSCTE